MTRIMSLLVLGALIAVIGMLSFEVLSAFILPLFLAGMAAVLLRPLHERLTRACRHHSRVAAVLTTVILALGVLLPSAALGLIAASEAASIAKSRRPASTTPFCPRTPTCAAPSTTTDRKETDRC